MPCPLPYPPVCIDALLRRYDGSPPNEELLAALAGEPADPVLRRALSREIDRAALSTLHSIAGLRESWVRFAMPPRCSAGIDDLSVGLAAYRRLGLHLTGTASKGPA